MFRCRFFDKQATLKRRWRLLVDIQNWIILIQSDPFFASDFDQNLNNEWTTTVESCRRIKKTKSLPLKMVPSYPLPNDRFREKIFRKKLIRIVARLDLDLCVFLDYLSWIFVFVRNKKKSLSKLVFFFSRRFTLSVYCCVWLWQKTVFFYLLFFVIDDISVVICVWRARKEEFFFSFASFNRIKSLSHLQLCDKKWTIRCE